MRRKKRWTIIALALLGSWGLLEGEQIDPRYATNRNCEACHTAISKQWQTSRHAHSHFTKNDLYDKTLDYIVAHELTKTKEEIVVECAKCHNPRIEKRSINSADKLGLLLDIDKKSLDRILETPTMKNGINCIVCHNVDKIHLDKKGGKRGFDAVEFGPQGIMYGPFEGAVSPYHKTQKREFFVKDPNRLCFVCHYSDTNDFGVEVYSTGKEYEAAKAEHPNAPQCIECHMSGKKKGIASNFGGEGGRVKRLVRDHLFASIDNSKIYEKYLTISAKRQKDRLTVSITSQVPHKVPTGYGLRDIEIRVAFFGKDGKQISEQRKLYTAHWINEQGEETIPHLARKKGLDDRLAPYADVAETFTIPNGTHLINYKVIYRQIDPKMDRRLGVRDPFFTNEYVLKNGVIEF